MDYKIIEHHDHVGTEDVIWYDLTVYGIDASQIEELKIIVHNWYITHLEDLNEKIEESNS